MGDIKTYKEYKKEKIDILENKKFNIEDKISTLLFLVEKEEYLNENLDILSEEMILEDIKSWLNKYGLKIHKGDGIIDYLKQFSTGAGKLILAAIKGDKEEVKRIANSLEKEKVVDFLFKLDMVSLHLITGPIHVIDAITGWDLVANLKQATKKTPSIIKDILDSIKDIKNKVVKVFDKKHYSQIILNLSNIEQSIPKVA